MAEQIFPEGMRLYAPHKNAPEFIKGQVVINVMELHEWLKANWNEKREVRLDLKEGKSGALYLSLNTWKKEGRAENVDATDDVAEEDPAESIPF